MADIFLLNLIFILQSVLVTSLQIHFQINFHLRF